jgi:hypothetical protein
VLVFQLTVRDRAGQAATDTVQVSVLDPAGGTGVVRVRTLTKAGAVRTNVWCRARRRWVTATSGTSTSGRARSWSSTATEGGGPTATGKPATPGPASPRSGSRSPTGCRAGRSRGPAGHRSRPRRARARCRRRGPCRGPSSRRPASWTR